MADFKEGDRVRHKTSGQEWVLRPGGQWEEVLVSGGTAAGIGFIDKAVQNVLNTPAAIEGGIDAASRGVATGVDAAARTAGNLLNERPAAFGEELAGSRERFADSTTQTIPRFGDFRNIGEDIRTGVGALGDRTLEESRGRAQTMADQARELFPRATAGGEFGADFGALATARRAPARARGRAAQTRQEQAEQFVNEFRTTKRQLDPEVQKKLDDTATKVAKGLKKGGQSLASGGLKFTEAGIEGAYLAALNNDDPVVSASAMAGTQAAGSLGLWLSGDVRSRLIPFALSAFATHELWKVFAPGPTNFFESEDFAFQLAAAGLSVGVLGGLAGAGRAGSSAIKHPQLADALTSLTRAAIENRWREFADNMEDGDPLPQLVMERIGRDPKFFNQNQMNSLERAFMSKKKGAFTNEVQRLMRDSKDFRDRIAELERQRAVPEGAEPIRTGRGARDLSLFTPTQPIQRNAQ